MIPDFIAHHPRAAAPDHDHAHPPDVGHDIIAVTAIALRALQAMTASVNGDANADTGALANTTTKTIP